MLRDNTSPINRPLLRWREESEMTLGQVKGTRNAQLLCTTLFNSLRIDAGSVATHSDDCTFTYAIVTDQKLRKAQIEDATRFIAGFTEALRVYDLLPQ
jgi:hypothetical protein